MTVLGMAVGSDKGEARNRVEADTRWVAAVVGMKPAEAGHKVVVDMILEEPDRNQAVQADQVEELRPVHKGQLEAETQQAEKQVVLDREQQRQPEFG